MTICLEDCKEPTIRIEKDKVYFKGIGGTDNKEHEVTINLYKEIDPDKAVQSPKGRNFELILSKTESGPFWPRLTKENKKFHWLKSDFNKWQDEDESDDDVGSNMNSNSLEEVIWPSFSVMLIFMLFIYLFIISTWLICPYVDKPQYKKT